jgi:hypothetical protein
MTETKAEPHVHKWRLHTHVDGCHFFQSVYACECGAVEAHGAERDFHDPDDPYSAVWMVDECKRCQELMKGAERKESL